MLILLIKRLDWWKPFQQRLPKFLCMNHYDAPPAKTLEANRIARRVMEFPLL